MRALRYHGTKDIRLEHDIPEPECGPRQVKIKPAFVGICGSDLHEYMKQVFVPTETNPHPVTEEYAPLILGHEFSGTVVEVGNEVRTVQVGDHVAVQPTICCQQCDVCLEGHTNCCPKIGFIGLHGWGGGLSDFTCVDKDYVFKLPSNVPLDVGALIEPLAVSWHAVEATEIVPGDEALVLGAGPIGIGVILCLKARGASTIIVSEVSVQRRKLAKEFGATHVLDPTVQNVVEEARRICAGNGPRLAIDCAGVPASINAACGAVRARGKIVNVAIWTAETPFQPNLLVFGEKSYSAVLAYRRSDYEGVIEALANGSLCPEAMITSKIAIDRVVEDGFEALIRDNDKHVKILIDLAL